MTDKNKEQNKELALDEILAMMRKDGTHISDPEAKVIVAMADEKAKKYVADLEAKTAKKNRICSYVTTGIDLIAKVGTAACSVLIFASGIEYEKTGSYTSPFTKAMAQNAMKKF